MTRINSNNNTHSKQRKTILIGDYIREERLGRGSFASVYKAKHKTSNEIVAIKDIYVEKMPEKNLEQEISIMRKIQHACIVELKDCIRTSSHVYLVMEYCSLGDLNTWLKEKCAGKGMCEQDLIHFLSQMASGLKYLRTRNFVHRDIKPQNILLVPSTSNPNGLPDIKISDFGFAKFLPNADLTSSFCGTPLYMAPEVLSRKSYDAKADLWSVGCLLYEMMMGRKLCQTNQMIELEQFLQNYNNQVDFTGSEYSFSQELKDLISVLLKKNPLDRASCEDFFHHVELLKLAKSPIMELNQDFTDTEEDEVEEDEDEEYVVVVDLKKTKTTSQDSLNSLADNFNNLTIDSNQEQKRYSTSAPPPSLPPGQLYQRRSLDQNQFSFVANQQHQPIYKFNSNDDLTPLMIRERKFSVGSASSVLTKALSKASTKIFGGSNSSSSNNTTTSSPPSPVTPVTPPPPSHPYHQGDTTSQQTLVLEEVTLQKLLISSSLSAPSVVKIEQQESTIKQDKGWMAKTERLSEIIDAVETFADCKSKQSDEMPFDTILTAEVVVLYAKVISLIQLQMNQLKAVNHSVIFKKKQQQEMMQALQKRYDNNKKLSACYTERCDLDDDEDQDMIVGAARSNNRTVSIEKLLYDRALELSKEAAVKQLIEEDLTNCAEKYKKAILLLESIMWCNHQDHVFKRISKQDETILLNFINQIQARLEKVVATTTITTATATR